MGGRGNDASTRDVLRTIIMAQLKSIQNRLYDIYLTEHKPATHLGVERGHGAVAGLLLDELGPVHGGVLEGRVGGQRRLLGPQRLGGRRRVRRVVGLKGWVAVLCLCFYILMRYLSHIKFKNL